MRHPGFDVLNPASRGVELRVPLIGSLLKHYKCDQGVSERDCSKRGHASCTLTPFVLKKESEARQDRQDRLKAREDNASRKWMQGKKNSLYT